MIAARLIGMSLTLAFFGACGEPAAPGPSGAPAKPESKKDVFLFLGDSLTAGYGVARDEAYPSLLAERWKREKISFRVRNAGVSGSTAKGVLENLDWNVTEDVHTVFLAIGANDGLRGHDLDATRATLDEIVLGIRTRGARVVLAGIKIPPNYGPVYTKRFKEMYPEVAKKHNLKLMPFLLDGVAARPAYNIADGMHPNEKGHRIMAENIHAFLSREGIIP
ncbi:MAG: arylesterase [Elusimicrobiota bacterium]